MRKRTRVAACMAAGLMASSMGVAAASGDSGQKDLAEVRRHTAQYHNVQKAIDAGYMPTEDCEPGMGYHFVNFGQFGQMDPLAPDVLLYASNPQGKLRLVGVEWLKPVAAMAPGEEAPSLFGKVFDGPMPGHEPAMPADLVHYDLHAYIWQGNPDGVLATWNRNIHCPNE